VLLLLITDGSMFPREDLDEEEYEETKSETKEQLKEFNESLSRMQEGDLSLVDDVNRIQLVSSFLLIRLHHDIMCVYAGNSSSHQ
jgi:hypothetical protein